MRRCHNSLRANKSRVVSQRGDVEAGGTPMRIRTLKIPEKGSQAFAARARWATKLVLSWSLLTAGTVQAQQPPTQPGSYSENLLTPPAPARVFRLESEPMLRERMAKD